MPTVGFYGYMTDMEFDTYKKHEKQVKKYVRFHVNEVIRKIKDSEPVKVDESKLKYGKRGRRWNKKKEEKVVHKEEDKHGVVNNGRKNRSRTVFRPRSPVRVRVE